MPQKKIIAWIRGKIGLDTKDFKKGTQRVKKDTKGIGDSFKKVQGIVAGSVLAVTVMKWGKALFNTAKDMALLDAKAKTVFGSYINQVKAVASETAGAMGLTQNEYVKAASGIQDLLVPMKFTREEATGMSLDLMKLSGALSQWTGGQFSATEVGKIFTKAMLGEREELKSLGISITEADVKMRLAERSQSKLTGTALQQAKAQATLELITEKSTDAQAQFAEGSENLVTITAQASAEYKTAGENLAKILTPGFTQGAKAARDFGGALSQVTGMMATLADEGKLGKAMLQIFGSMGGYGGVVAAATDAAVIEWQKGQAAMIAASEMSSAEQILAVQELGDVASREWRKLHDEHQKLKKKEAEDATAAAKAEAAAVAASVAQQIAALSKLKEADNRNMAEMETQGEKLNQIRESEAEGYLVIDTANKKLQETYAGTIKALTNLNEQFMRVPETTQLAGVAYNEVGQVIEERRPAIVRTWEDFSLGEKVITGVADAMQSAAIGFGGNAMDMVRAGANAARQIISQEIAKAVTIAAAKALTSVPFPFNIAAAGIAGAAAGALFNSLVPKFGDGALVTGPMLAMVGEKGPELIVPLNKLGDLGGGDSMTILKGEDIWITQDKRNKRHLGSR